MSPPTWRFKERQRNDTHQDPANTEFFARQDVADRLVRESGQNSMDAVKEGATARLSFTLASAPAFAWQEYMATLWPHLEAHEELREGLPNRDENVPCLLVEDFGTTGLTGPLEPSSDEVSPDEKSHRLFWFFKNVGRTSKTGEQLGSFGIGKTVFPYSSRVSSFLGLTVRQASSDESPIVLVGFSQLKEHKLPGGRVLTPYGYYCWQEGAGADYEQRPISEPSLIDRFRGAFGVRRANDETGLSVVIPYPVSDLSRPHLARAAITQFFLPILSGQLVVELHEGEQHDILTPETLLEAIQRFEWAAGERERLERQLKLANWAVRENPTIVELARPASDTQPRFDSAMIDPSQRARLSREFISGHRLALRVPVPVEPKGSAAIWSHVDVFLEYDWGGADKEDLYVRRGLTLIDHTGRARQAGLRSILIAQDPPLYEMLRSSENVAHTEWRQRSAAKLTQKYVRGPSKVGYVLGIVPGLIQALLSPEDEADWWTLADLFPDLQASPFPERPVSATEEGQRASTAEEEAPTEETDVEFGPFPEPPARQWVARPLAAENALCIQKNPRYDGALRPMRLTAAYAALRGRKLRDHDPADFSFLGNSEMIDASHASVEASADNVVRIVPSSPDFLVKIKGFDRHRALDYRVEVEEE